MKGPTQYKPPQFNPEDLKLDLKDINSVISYLNASIINARKGWDGLEFSRAFNIDVYNKCLKNMESAVKALEACKGMADSLKKDVEQNLAKLKKG